MLIASGTASGALVGFGAGVAGQLLARSTLTTLAALVTIAVAADLIASRFTRLKPLAIGTQVPVAWSRMFSPPVVALLYGARLGVGPLTILSTWLWWAVTLGAATVGVGTSVTVGAFFGFVRLTTTALASLRAEQQGHTAWFLSLRTNTARAWTALGILALVGSGLGLLAGFGT